MPEYKVSGRVIVDQERILFVKADNRQAAADEFVWEFPEAEDVIIDDIECIDTEEACKEGENGGA